MGTKINLNVEITNIEKKNEAFTIYYIKLYTQIYTQIKLVDN